MKVLKFGGSSVATAERIRRVGEIIRDAGGSTRLVVVASAMGGVTDLLVKAAEQAAAGDPSYREACSAIESRHLAVIDELATAEERPGLRDAVADRWWGFRATTFPRAYFNVPIGLIPSK